MRKLTLFLVALATAVPFANSADTVENRLAALEAAVHQMQTQLGAKDAEIATLSARLAEYEHEEHEEHEEESRIAISGVLNTAVGGGDERVSVIDSLQSGAHDPRKRVSICSNSSWRSVGSSRALKGRLTWSFVKTKLN